MSEPGQSQGGGSTKYIVGGLLLLVAAALVFFFLFRAPKEQVAAPQVAPPPPPASAERVNPMAEPELILDEEPKDAGQPAAAVTDKPKKVGNREPRGDWDCDGDVAVAALKSVVDSNRAQVRTCYERQLKVNNVLQGDLKLKLKIAASGKIGAAQVNGSLKDEKVFSCVKALAQKWSFPPPTNGTCAVVQVPFNFTPQQ